MNSEAYHLAQQAIADLKSAVYIVLEAAPSTGLTNAEIGRSLGIYSGPLGHEGDIPRTVLGLLENEGVVQQNSDNKHWTLRRYPEKS